MDHDPDLFGRDRLAVRWLVVISECMETRTLPSKRAGDLGHSVKKCC